MSPAHHKRNNEHEERDEGWFDRRGYAARELAKQNSDQDCEPDQHTHHTPPEDILFTGL
jgi:hypothetical protein